MLGDFNDSNGENYWKEMPIVIMGRDGVEDMHMVLSTDGFAPPKSCCTGEVSLRKGFSREPYIGDYILIDRTKMSYEIMPDGLLYSNKIPDSFNRSAESNPTSDHLPVECKIKLLLDNVGTLWSACLTNSACNPSFKRLLLTLVY